MPKLKTNKAVAKRMSLTKNGKLKRQHMGRRHLLTDKSPKTKRQLRKHSYVSPHRLKLIKSVLHD